jgi:hypothetical protein
VAYQKKRMKPRGKSLSMKFEITIDNASHALVEEPQGADEDNLIKELEILELGQHPKYLQRVKQLQDERCHSSSVRRSNVVENSENG